ncbi:sodium:proton antiporter [Reichenbachiella agarivorans]|uniref:Sodium:proton antiporter n=1 Tax=Reichenbachiella agarivorans TaxID=2979464 RepID=A0ABY6CYI1_9BACT|nr:sodium:proton antiporter [Reichenbachiella agarivorans]UXP33285.1 sodium:proton antiporter [Reichenbachiella agarivorans]
MRKFFILFLLLIVTQLAVANTFESDIYDDHTASIASTEVSGDIEAEHHHAPAWTVIPFVLLLLMIATGPLFYEHFWHKNYPIVACVLAGIVVIYYLFVLHNHHSPVHAVAEYLQFIALLSGLFIASGGIMIEVDKEAKPFTNVIILLIGALIANIIGTTGASMLLIRPFIRLNKNRIKPYHIIFFIFMVSNIGGSLTPIGDPPLFLGFLKGVPFFWTLKHNLIPWLFASSILGVIFYIIDKRNKTDYSFGEDTDIPTGKITFTGTKNFAWLAVIVGSVFLDPNVLEWVPAITYEGQKFSFVRELIMLSCGFLSYKMADKKALEGNEFNFEPIREVAFIFIGIFGTMMPALELVGNFAQSDAGAAMITPNTLFWGTGLLSGFLDNAPTYINFLTAAMASQGASINSLVQVVDFARGGSDFVNSILSLKAISVAAVFFGSMTYIGNGPNFMVKSIAEQVGIKMPSFFGYIIRFSIPVLLPLFLLVWLVFFYWGIL